MARSRVRGGQLSDCTGWAEREREQKEKEGVEDKKKRDRERDKETAIAKQPNYTSKNIQGIVKVGDNVQAVRNI